MKYFTVFSLLAFMGWSKILVSEFRSDCFQKSQIKGRTVATDAYVSDFDTLTEGFIHGMQAHRLKLCGSSTAFYGLQLLLKD